MQHALFAHNGSFPAARVFRSTPQTVGAANTILSFDGERFDTANLHSPTANPSRLRAPLAGVYLITANVNWDLPDGTPIWMGLRRNGGLTGDAFIAAEAETAQVSDEQALSTIYKLAAGDFIDVVVHQGSGADATVGPGDNRASLAMTWLGKG